jgi:hypothetical protein
MPEALEAVMETNKQGQTTYEAEANAAHPEGCKCPDRSGSCDWCQIYYDGPPEIPAEPGVKDGRVTSRREGQP